MIYKTTKPEMIELKPHEKVIKVRRKIIVDKPLVKVIQTLNDKGYYTRYCCAGHINPDEPAFILFEQSWTSGYYSLSKIPEFANIKNLGFKVEEFQLCTRIESLTPRYSKKAIKTLENWAGKLPDKSFFYL